MRPLHAVALNSLLLGVSQIFNHKNILSISVDQANTEFGNQYTMMLLGSFLTNLGSLALARLRITRFVVSFLVLVWILTFKRLHAKDSIMWGLLCGCMSQICDTSLPLLAQNSLKGTHNIDAELHVNLANIVSQVILLVGMGLSVLYAQLVGFDTMQYFHATLTLVLITVCHRKPPKEGLKRISSNLAIDLSWGQVLVINVVFETAAQIFFAIWPYYFYENHAAIFFCFLVVGFASGLSWITLVRRAHGRDVYKGTHILNYRNTITLITVCFAMGYTLLTCTKFYLVASILLQCAVGIYLPFIGSLHVAYLTSRQAIQVQLVSSAVPLALIISAPYIYSVLS